MDLFCLISKPVLFFSVENFRRPIRNHFLYLEAVAVADNYTVLMTMTINREKLSGEDSSFISFLVSVFPDIWWGQGVGVEGWERALIASFWNTFREIPSAHVDPCPGSSEPVTLGLSPSSDVWSFLSRLRVQFQLLWAMVCESFYGLSVTLSHWEGALCCQDSRRIPRAFMGWRRPQMISKSVLYWRQLGGSKCSTYVRKYATALTEELAEWVK